MESHSKGPFGVDCFTEHDSLATIQVVGWIDSWFLLEAEQCRVGRAPHGVFTSPPVGGWVGCFRFFGCYNSMCNERLCTAFHVSEHQLSFLWDKCSGVQVPGPVVSFMRS